MKAGVHVKVVSERLGHADVAFTLRTYSHVIPGLDRDAANHVADLILGPGDTPNPDTDEEPDTTARDADGHSSGHTTAETPLDPEEGRA